MARTYKRDSRGRFAGGGSGGSRKGRSLPSPTKRTASGKTKRQGLLTQRAAVSAAQAKLKAKNTGDKSLTAQLSMRAQKAAVTRAKNKLAAAQQTGRIRLKATDRAGVIRPGRRNKSQAVTPEVVSPVSGSSRVPASQRPGSITNTLRSTLRELAQSDARRIREIEAITGRPITAPKGRGGTPKLPGSAGTGKVKDALQGSLRGLAQSDARFYRELGQITQGTTAKLPGGKGSKRVKGSSRRRLPGS